MNRFTNPSLILGSILCALLGTAPLAAQTRSFAATDTESYGTTLAGGSTTLRASGSVTVPDLRDITAPTTLVVNASNRASVRLFGLTREAASMSAGLRADHAFSGFANGGLQFTNTSSGTFTVRIGGYTVLSDSRTNTTLSNDLAADVFVADVPTYSVSLLGCGITVRGGAVARARYALSPQVNFGSTLSASLNGPVRSSATGIARASVSVLGATAGVRSTLTYADTNANVNLFVSPTGATGTVAFTVAPIRFAMSVFASFAGLSATQEIVDWAQPSESRTLVLQPQ